MIKDSLVKALIDHLNVEYYVAYPYLTMSAYTDRLGCKGIEKRLVAQAKEETDHGTHIYHYLLEWGAAYNFIHWHKETKTSFSGAFSWSSRI